MAVARQNPPDPWLFIGSVVAVGGSFVGGVVVGTGSGRAGGRSGALGTRLRLSRGVPGLVGAQLHSRADWLVALASGNLAVAIALVLPGNWHIIVAGVTVSAVAALVLDAERA